MQQGGTDVPELAGVDVLEAPVACVLLPVRVLRGMPGEQTQRSAGRPRDVYDACTWIGRRLTEWTRQQ